MFVFHDDDFFTRDAARDLGRMTALRDALRARGVNDVALVVKARPDDVDAKVFAVLQEIGLLRVYLGIEAGSTQGLKVLGRGVDLAENRRGARLAPRARRLHLLQHARLRSGVDARLAPRELRASCADYADVPMNFCRTEIYVGTPLMTKLEREGRLVGDVFGWDYAIRDPRAERAFRVFASAFLDRNFRCDGLMNSTLGLGYHLHLLRTFYPRAPSRGLAQRVTETTRKVNLDCVERMEAILDFAESPASEERAALEDFTAEDDGRGGPGERTARGRGGRADAGHHDGGLRPPRAAPRARQDREVGDALRGDAGARARCRRATSRTPRHPRTRCPSPRWCSLRRPIPCRRRSSSRRRPIRCPRRRSRRAAACRRRRMRRRRTPGSRNPRSCLTRCRRRPIPLPRPMINDPLPAPTVAPKPRSS